MGAIHKNKDSVHMVEWSVYNRKENTNAALYLFSLPKHVLHYRSLQRTGVCVWGGGGGVHFH